MIEEARAILAEHRDLLEARPPFAVADRSWNAYLASLDDDELARLESNEPPPRAAPHELRSLFERARAACNLPMLASPSFGSARPHERPQKTAQIEAFAAIALPLAKRARRVVDVGSGHGHLTRALAERLELPVLGLERDPSFVRRARQLACDDAMFARVDVLHEGLAIERDDLVVGLHACGELGDALIAAAARTGASAVLIGCCPQKRREGTATSLALPRSVLGLGNLVAREEGVEATRAENLAARERRLALMHLLGEDDAGAEIRGLNRRAAHDDLSAFVTRAFAVRGLAPPAPRAIESAAAWAKEAHARARRLSIPRTWLGRVLEVLIAHERAAALPAHATSVGLAFPAAVSPRNVAVVAAFSGEAC